MIVVVKSMMRARDKDVGLHKVIDSVVEMSGEFNGRNVIQFLDVHRR